MQVTLTYQDSTVTVEIDSEYLYNWIDGNYSCDCNRAMIMRLSDDFPCNVGENEIHAKITQDGVIVYED